MVYLQRALFSLVFLITYSVTSATTDQLWDSVESDLDETIESGDPVHKPLINFLINPKDLQKAGIPESSSEEKRFGFTAMRGKRFNNDVEFPLVRNNKRARFFGLRGKRVPSLEHKFLSGIMSCEQNNIGKEVKRHKRFNGHIFFMEIKLEV